MFHEVVAVGRALGYDESIIPTAAIDASISETALINKRPGHRHKPSMLLDLEQHQPLELDVILGDVIRRARVLHVDIPVECDLQLREQRLIRGVQRIETLHALLSVVQMQLIKPIVRHEAQAQAYPTAGCLDCFDKCLTS